MKRVTPSLLLVLTLAGAAVSAGPVTHTVGALEHDIRKSL